MSTSLPVTFSPHTDMFTLVESPGNPLGQGVTHRASPSAWHNNQQPPSSRHHTRSRRRHQTPSHVGFHILLQTCCTHTDWHMCAWCELVWLSHTSSQKFVCWSGMCGAAFGNASVLIRLTTRTMAVQNKAYRHEWNIIRNRNICLKTNFFFLTN